MKPKQLFLLAAVFLIAAVLTLLVPVHPWFNQPQGLAVLSGFALLLALAGVVKMLPSKGDEPEGRPPADPPSRRLVSEEFLAVVSPRCDATPDQRKLVAAALRAWLARPYAVRVHGLEQLEAGEHPRVLAPHVMKVMKVLPPEQLQRLDPADCYWGVTLLEVKEGTDEDLACRELDADLSSVIDLLGFTADPSAYDAARM